MKYRVKKYMSFSGQQVHIELGDHTYGEWIIYENNSPKFHININDDKSKSDIHVSNLIDKNKWTIENILEEINKKENRKLNLGKNPLLKLKISYKLEELTLNPLPYELVENLLIKFDPLKNYYALDLTIERESVTFNFWELIKTLIAFSSDVAVQKEYAGPGNFTQELEIDFGIYFTSIDRYLYYGLLNEFQIQHLIDFNEFLNSQESEFWNDDVLESSLAWQECRKFAKELLGKMGYHNLTIEVICSSHSEPKGYDIYSMQTFIREEKNII